MLRNLKKSLIKTILLLSILAIALLVWGSFMYRSISITGEETVPQSADVIIVLGAAVWPNGPSPALQARLTHAFELYQEGYADHIILTGGLGTYPPTEAEAMEIAMVNLGLQREVMHLEEKATNTIENIKFSKEIMDNHSWQSAIIVSDFFHIKRALLIAKDFGINAYGAPAKNSVLYRNQDLRTSNTLREVLALTRYYFIRLFI